MSFFYRLTNIVRDDDAVTSFDEIYTRYSSESNNSAYKRCVGVNLKSVFPFALNTQKRVNRKQCKVYKTIRFRQHAEQLPSVPTVQVGDNVLVSTRYIKDGMNVFFSVTEIDGHCEVSLFGEKIVANDFAIPIGNIDLTAACLTNA